MSPLFLYFSLISLPVLPLPRPSVPGDTIYVIPRYTLMTRSLTLHSISAIYALFTIVTLYSLYPSKSARAAHRARVAEKKAEKEKWASTTTSPYDNEMTAEEQWQHMWELQQLPRTPGTAGGMKSPITPRTRAFQDLGGSGKLHAGERTPGTATHLMYPSPPIPAAYGGAGGAGDQQVYTNADYYGQEQGQEQIGQADSYGQVQPQQYDAGDVEGKGKGTAY